MNAPSAAESRLRSPCPAHVDTELEQQRAGEQSPADAYETLCPSDIWPPMPPTMFHAARARYTNSAMVATPR